ILAPTGTLGLREGGTSLVAVAGGLTAETAALIALIVSVAELATALALAIPGEAIMGVWGPDYVAGTAALAFLLAAEVAASMAVVSESVLVYIAKKRNLAISVFILSLQAALTFACIIGMERFAARYNLDEDGFATAGPALALFLALSVSSLIKALVLKTLLKAPVSNWRWGLVWATGPAVVVG
ncbi:MAG: lipopolysaccharide biosynthesis protein, partial [Pseudomonadota bacterium]